MNHARKAWKISCSRGVPSTPARRSGALCVPMPGTDGSLHYLHTLRPAVYDRRAFVRNWTEPARIGICAGGYFYAHGIEAVEGHAVITIKSLRVLP